MAQRLALFCERFRYLLFYTSHNTVSGFKQLFALDVGIDQGDSLFGSEIAHCRRAIAIKKLLAAAPQAASKIEVVLQLGLCCPILCSEASSNPICIANLRLHSPHIVALPF
jgi:hypothetical protein